MQLIAISIGRELGLAADELEPLAHAALFHDIGKLTVPVEILLKPAALSEREWRIMRRHAAEGEQMADALGLPRAVPPAIRHHHERYDGTGYPDGRAGEEIPLPARIIHLADALDSMLMTRTYRPGRSPAAAVAEVKKESGAQFDPACVDALERVIGVGGLAEIGVSAATLAA